MAYRAAVGSIYVCWFKAIDARLISVEAAYEGATSSDFAPVEE
jgi:hypothetical protein